MHRSPTTALRVGFCLLAVAAGSAPASALTECGEASWYDHAGRKTASGGTVEPNTLTAAHPSLPFGSKMDVENLQNGKTVTVEIDDRGPFTQGRIIDVSRAAAEQLEFKGDGVTDVRISKPGTKAAGKDIACGQ
jgi:rare lipoprotein A